MMTELHMKRDSPTGPANLHKVEFAYVVSQAPGRSGPTLAGKLSFVDPWTPEIAKQLGKLVEMMEAYVVMNAPLFESPTSTEDKAPTLAPIIPWDKVSGAPPEVDT